MWRVAVCLDLLHLVSINLPTTFLAGCSNHHHLTLLCIEAILQHIAPLNRLFSAALQVVLPAIQYHLCSNI